MSSRHLAPEILEDIVDLLHDDEQALRSCCLASKSWIERTRKRLFAGIEFQNKMHLKSWKDTFLDPATSPAQYTKTLSIKYPCHFTMQDVGWIRTFASVRRFKMDSSHSSETRDTHISLIPLYAFSPALESLHIVSRGMFSSRIFKLALTFPLLHSLEVNIRGFNREDYDYGWYDASCPPDDGSKTIPPPLILPVLTGTLKLRIRGGLMLMAPMILSLNGNIRARRLDLECRGDNPEDVKWTQAILKECLPTVETLGVYLTHTHVRLDISRARNLKKLEFRCGEPDVKWVIETLQTVAPEHENLQILVFISHGSAIHRNRSTPLHVLRNRPYYTNFVDALGATLHERWLDLDRLFMQLSESHSIRPKILYYEPPPVEKRWGVKWMEQLLPEATKVGIVDKAAVRL